MDFSFPYPVNAAEARPVGQGCLSCVHKDYCQALYWYKRYTFKGPDNHNGIQCASWSDNPADIVTAHNQRDLDEEQYIWEQGIGSEPNRSGITDQSGDTWRRP
jgi:hypothetical protein